MRAPLIYALVLVGALALAGCSAEPGLSGSPTTSGTSSSSAPAVAASPVPLPEAAATLPPVAAVALTPGATPLASSDPTTTAVQAVIQKADQEQQDAFTKNDPTIMKDTATSSYYNDLVQTNSDMAKGGVTAIKLVGIDWGPVTLTNPTTAQATNYETWQTTYSDGSSDQTRELNTYVLVQQQGSWLIQSNDHPNATSSSSAASPGSGPSGSVAPGSPTAVPPTVAPPASGTSNSRNWAGYAASSGNFTAVTGTWTVPKIMSAGSFGTDATWVGIGGTNSRDLIQAGTEETTDGSGNVQWDGWIEMLPQSSRPVEFAVHPGDSVTVSITQKGAPNQWLIQMKNNTTAETYQTTVQYKSTLSSAEWIEEAPSSGGRGGKVLPLDNFGTVQFSRGTAVQNGKAVTIAQSGAQPITLAGPSGSTLVMPSVLTADGQGFTVTRAGSMPIP